MNSLNFRYYYKFKIDVDQNEMLYDTERAIGGSALVRYATPCFHTYIESDAFVANGTIAQRTHFQSPSRLRNHNMYTYVLPYRHGRAYSEPMDLEPIYFFKEIYDALRKDNNRHSFVKHLCLLWLGFTKSEVLGTPKLTHSDRKSAMLAFGSYSDLPLDPLKSLDEEHETIKLIFGNEIPFLTLEDYATLFFAVQRIIREKLFCQWLILY